jgi:hypothetical protein
MDANRRVIPTFQDHPCCYPRQMRETPLPRTYGSSRLGSPLLMLLAACATAPPPAPVSPAPAPIRPEPAAVVTVEQDARRLPPGATFADVVDAARAADSAGETHSEAGCLLRAGPPPRLEADLMPGARPLPPAEPRLTALIENRIGSVGVLSAWGNVGGELSDLWLLAFTTTTPNAVRLPAIGLFVTPGGVFVRGADPLLRAQPDALSAAAATALLARSTAPATVYVTADAGVPLTTLIDLLRAVPDRFELALALALPKNTRLPPPAAASSEGMCPDGLPAPAKGDREGTLQVEAAQAAVAPLRQAALACALAAGGRALLGGRVVLGLRIGPTGRASEACIVRDELNEPLMRRCLRSAARDLSFPVPTPGGFADLEIPLQIALEGPSPQRASCE